jgi:sugar phosphate permease
VLLAAMSDVDPRDSGLASGIVNTSFMMGGALGLAVLASLAAAQAQAVAGPLALDAQALNSGYHAAFAVGGIFAVVAAFGGMLLGPAQPRGEPAASALDAS